MACATQPGPAPAATSAMDRAIALLLLNGYSPVNRGDSACRTFRDPESRHLLTLSGTPALASDFCRACLETPENPHLPRILAQGMLGPEVHVRMTENLLCSSDYADENERTTRSGHARAFSTLFEGDEMHSSVHPLMVSPSVQESGHLIAAIRLIAACGKAFCGASGPAARPVRLDADGRSVLFRPGSNAAVFADPLIADEDTAATACYRRLEWVETRFSAQELEKQSSRYWRPATAPAPVPAQAH